MSFLLQQAVPEITAQGYWHKKTSIAEGFSYYYL